jgi:hypothetical protein
MPPDENTGWRSFAPGTLAKLPPDERTAAERRMAEHAERRGALLAVVQVRVYEHEEQPQVTFPPEAQFDLEADLSGVDELVARARRSLEGWR